ncbi:MAG: hypothetical protein HZB53_08340 [Chloroflexi bacterium]|nr:hypothetical protein [Chloroflexota bacterium]
MIDDIRSRINLYISAAPGLSRERGVLGHAVTTIPTTLGWAVTFTPGPGEPLDAAAVARADAHILVLGEDITAPVGLEWQIARRAGRLPALFRREMLHTPAADAFARDVTQYADWRPYRDAADLRRIALGWLGKHLLDRATRYALNPDEQEKLRAWLAELESAPAPGAESVRETSHSGIVLSPERYVPGEGKIIK